MVFKFLFQHFSVWNKTFHKIHAVNKGEKEISILALLIITLLKAYSMISPIHKMPRFLSSFNPSQSFEVNTIILYYR